MGSEMCIRDREDSTIKQLANSVLTFSDLITNRKTDYKFDLEKFTNVNGKTGIYVQYAQVRAKKLQQSITQQKDKMESLVLSDVDKQLLSQLFMFGYFLEQSSSLNEPHHLANYLYDISNSFNQFYFIDEGIKTHFLHIKSPEKNALPLLLIHGWPGSIFEFLDIIPILTNPIKYGIKSYRFQVAHK